MINSSFPQFLIFRISHETSHIGGFEDKVDFVDLKIWFLCIYCSIFSLHMCVSSPSDYSRVGT